MANEPLSLQEMAADYYLDKTMQLGMGSAATAGRPAGHTDLPPEEEERTYRLRARNIDEWAIAQQLVNEGWEPYEAAFEATYRAYPLRRDMVEQADVNPNDPTPVARYAEDMRKRAILKPAGVDFDVPPGYAPGPADPTPEELGLEPGPAPTRPLPAGVEAGSAPVRPLHEEPPTPSLEGR